MLYRLYCNLRQSLEGHKYNIIGQNLLATQRCALPCKAPTLVRQSLYEFRPCFGLYFKASRLLVFSPFESGCGTNKSLEVSNWSLASLPLPLPRPSECIFYWRVHHVKGALESIYLKLEHNKINLHLFKIYVSVKSYFSLVKISAVYVSGKLVWQHSM